MIQQYNAYQPDFGQKITQDADEWIDPFEIINSDQRRPFKIKHKTKIFKGVASGQNIMSANRQKLEEDRRQMMQFNVAGSNISVNARIEEEKKIQRLPPRVASSKHRSKQQSLRVNYNAPNNRDSSMMNQSSTLYNVVNRSNRVAPPCPVRIPKEVTEGVELLRSIRMAAEGMSAVNQSSHFEETKSPGSFISPQNILQYQNNRPQSGIRVKKKSSKKLTRDSKKNEESKLINNESVLTKELKEWNITNLLERGSKKIPSNHPQRQFEFSSERHVQEEEKVPQTFMHETEFNFDLPADMPPGGNERMEYLRQMEQQLFPNEPQQNKKDKNRIKAYKKIRDAASESRKPPSHNFVGKKSTKHDNDTSIERYLKEIRGEARTEDGFIPGRHPNRIRGPNEQDDINHPLLSDALAYDSEGRPASVIGSDNRFSMPLSSTQPDSDEYVMPNVDPAEALKNEIQRNKQAKARLRLLEKQYSIQKAREEKPLEKYYQQKGLRHDKPKATSYRPGIGGVSSAAANRSNFR